MRVIMELTAISSRSGFGSDTTVWLYNINPHQPPPNTYKSGNWTIVHSICSISSVWFSGGKCLLPFLLIESFLAHSCLDTNSLLQTGGFSVGNFKHFVSLYTYVYLLHPAICFLRWYPTSFTQAVRACTVCSLNSFFTVSDTAFSFKKWFSHLGLACITPEKRTCEKHIIPL